MIRHINEKNQFAIEEGKKLGLTDKQLKSTNFGFHTLDAIKDDIEKGIPIKVSFTKYQGLNNLEIEGITQYGLTREQVLTDNFGFHTLNAIKDDREKGIQIEASFTKYQGLNNSQIEGITQYDLTREQVLTDNFGFHILNAIKDIQKRSSEGCLKC